MRIRTKISILLLALFIGAGVFSINVQPAQAVSLAELQQIIEQLKTQIAGLQERLTAIQQGKEDPGQWCHTFNTNLRIGDKGAEVQALETALMKQGFSLTEHSSNFPAVFDEKMASAVVGFQEKYAKEVLSQWGLAYGTGFVGKSTRAKLNKFYGCGVSIQPVQPIIPPIVKDKPYCSAIGSRSEGWYQNTGADRPELIRWENCNGCYAVCEAIGSRSEGWYSSGSCETTGKLIGYAHCGQGDPQILPDCRDENYKCTIEDIPCCSGLKEVGYCFPEGDHCICATCGSICRPCGNGVCDANENRCSCPEDCGSVGENLPPVIDGLTAPTQLQVNEKGVWTIKARDPENGSLSYSVNWGDKYGKISLPESPSAEFDTGSQATTFTHSYSRAGTYTIRFTVTDNKRQTAKTSITVKVVGSATTCTDSDNGVKKYVKGRTCRDLYTLKDTSSSDPTTTSSFGRFCRTDRCIPLPDGYTGTDMRGYLTEYYCKNNKIFSKTMYCENGCADGACKKNELTSIKVKSPNGGEKWVVGETRDITWEAKGFEDNVALIVALVNDELNQTCRLVDGYVNAGQGKYSWEIGTDNCSAYYGSKLKVRIGESEGMRHPYISDESDDYFSIVAAEQICGDVNCDGAVNTDDSTLLFNYLTYGAEQYPICSAWAADVNCDGEITLSDSRKILNYVNNPSQYILGCCSTCQMLGDADGNGVLTCNDMNCAFAVCLDPSTQSQCPCSDVTGDGETTMSDVRKISNILKDNGIDCEKIPLITVISPNGGEQFQRGDSYTVLWRYSGSIDNVKITICMTPESYAQSAQGETRCDVGVTTDNDGSYSSQFGAAATIGNYTVKIEDASDATVYDESDDYFSIVSNITATYDPIRDNDMKALVIAGTPFANDTLCCLQGQFLADEWTELGFDTLFYCDTATHPLEDPYTTYQNDSAIKLVGLKGHGLGGSYVKWHEDSACAFDITEHYKDRGNIPYSMFWLSACGCDQTGDRTFADYVTENYINNCFHKGLTALDEEGTQHRYHQYLNQGYTVYDAWNTTLEWAKETYCPDGQCAGYLQWKWGTVMPNEDLRLPQFCGDVNYDNIVDSADSQILKDYLNGITEIHSDWDGDINGDESVNETDVFYLERHINNNTAAPHPKPIGWFITSCQSYDYNGIKGIQQDEIDQAQEDYDNGYLSQSDYLDVTNCE